MNQDHRLNRLEGCHDWHGLEAAIREVIDAEREPHTLAR
jgi:hypothetical protein